MNCGEEGCTCCAHFLTQADVRRPAPRRWESYQEALARDPLEARRTMAWALREPPEEYRRHVQACLGVAGYVPKEDEDDS